MLSRIASYASKRTPLTRALSTVNGQSSMAALVKAKPEKGLEMHEVPIPDIGPNDLLIKVNKTAICGTDMHIWNWDEWAQRTIPVPMHVGHEFAGEVVSMGVGVTGYKVGDRVSGEGHITCGHCRRCRAGQRHLCRNTYGVGVNRPGCFAEYLAIPASNAFPLPDYISDDVASFLDPLGNAVHTTLAFDLVGEDVLITGAGPIGIMACSIAKHVGARHVVITDVNDYRLDLAKTCGATAAINTSNVDATVALKEVMADLKMTEGFDVGLEMSGHGGAFQSMLRTMNHGGSVSLLGILPAGAGIEWDHVIFKGLVIKGIYGREMFETWYKMASMLSSGLNVDPVLTHRMAARDFKNGFDILNTGQAGKVVLNWNEL